MHTPVLYLILLAGALGGLAANIPVFSEPAAWTAFGPASLFKYIVGPAVLGAISAGIGVFVLTKTDTTDGIRTFFFAVICGLAFPQIIENAKRTVTGQAAAEVTDHALDESAQQLQRLVAKSKPDREAIIEATHLVTSLSGHGASPDVRLEALNALGGAASKLDEPADKAIAVDAVKTVGINAAARRDWETTLKAVTALQTIGREAAPEARAEASSAEGELVARLPETLVTGKADAAAHE